MNPINGGIPSATAPAAAKPPPRLSVPLAVGLGCSCMLFLLFLLVLATGGDFALVFGVLRSSDAYQFALSAAQHDPSVVAALGAPVDPGWFTMGEVSATPASGHATLSIPISGPRGAGTIDARADKAGGKWTFSTLSVHIDGRASLLNLLPPTPPLSAVAP